MVTESEREKLVQQLNNGNERAVNEAAVAIRNAAREMVQKVVRLGNGSAEDVNTVLNDTVTDLITILQKERYEPEKAKLTTLIYSIAKNKWLTILRLRHPPSVDRASTELEKHATDPWKNPIELHLFSKEERRLVRQAILQLEAEDRILIEKKYLEGVSLRIIADQLGISEQAVKKRHERCKKKMRQFLGKDPRLED